MDEILDFLISNVFLDTYNLDIVDNIKVTPKFMNYLKANEVDKIICEKADDQPNGMIVRYKGVPLVVDPTIDECYKVEYKYRCNFGKLIDVTSRTRENKNDTQRTY
jgi:hypothetical protein